MSTAEILISGAGPAGTTTSLFLSRLKIPHTLIDKAIFPRDKICGDALSGKVVNILTKINPKFVAELTDNSSHYTGSYGIRFFSPNGNKLDVPFSTNPEKLKNAPGFIARRINFDNYLFSKIDRNYAQVLEGTELQDLVRNGKKITATLKRDGKIFEKEIDLIIGADGDRSIVAKKLDPQLKKLNNYCAAIRAYYSGVSEFHNQKYIELHFLKELLPGYFWIFPMNDGTANVGIGILSEVVARKKINLRKEMESIIQNHPVIKNRFKDAKLEGLIQGWGLPLGSAKRPVSGDNYLLTGDAGSLIDPFTGEGIGNALYSGMLAAETTACAIGENKYDKTILSSYERKLYKNLSDELRLSHGIQKLAKYDWLFNFVVKKASGNKMLQETITCMFDDLDIRARLRKPSFYFKLLFNKG